jgi:hypothetical protein
VRLLQIDEGVVAVTGTLPAPGLCYRVYLSNDAGDRGSLLGDYPEGNFKGTGPFACFLATPGAILYATINAYDPTSKAESPDSPQLLLQMYQVLQTGFKISSFFHERDTEVVWALGHKWGESGLTTALMSSSDYFTTSSVFKTWEPGEINFAGYEMYATIYTLVAIKCNWG